MCEWGSRHESKLECGFRSVCHLDILSLARGRETQISPSFDGHRGAEITIQLIFELVIKGRGSEI
jgi:hypothetical protein